MALRFAVGERVLIKFVGEDLFHEFPLGARGPSEHSWVVASADFDIYDLNSDGYISRSLKRFQSSCQYFSDIPF